MGVSSIGEAAAVHAGFGFLPGICRQTVRLVGMYRLMIHPVPVVLYSLAKNAKPL
jgi:hypothetical protein